MSGIAGFFNSVSSIEETGNVTYSTAGTYTWIAPATTTSVSVVCVGGGGAGNGGPYKGGYNGGKGIVVVKTDRPAVSTTGSPSNPSLGLYIFNSDGSITF